MKQVTIERVIYQKGFSTIPEVVGPGGAALGGRIPPKLEIAQHREKSGNPGSIPGFGDFLSDSRLFTREKEGDAGKEQGGGQGGSPIVPGPQQYIPFVWASKVPEMRLETIFGLM